MIVFAPNRAPLPPPPKPKPPLNFKGHGSNKGIIYFEETRTLCTKRSLINALDLQVE